MSDGEVKCLCGKGKFVWSVEDGHECNFCGAHWNGRYDSFEKETPYATKLILKALREVMERTIEEEVEYFERISSIPDSVDYDEDPCVQVNKMCEIAKEAIRKLGEKIERA